MVTSHLAAFFFSFLVSWFFCVVIKDYFLFWRVCIYFLHMSYLSVGKRGAPTWVICFHACCVTDYAQEHWQFINNFHSAAEMAGTE